MFDNLIPTWDARYVPRPWFGFSIIHGSGRVAKNGEGVGTLIVSLIPSSSKTWSVEGGSGDETNLSCE